MSERDFIYWLQGFFELAKPNALTPEQVSQIRAHLNLVLECKTVAEPIESDPQTTEPNDWPKSELKFQPEPWRRFQPGGTRFC